MKEANGVHCRLHKQWCVLRRLHKQSGVHRLHKQSGVHHRLHKVVFTAHVHRLHKQSGVHCRFHKQSGFHCRIHKQSSVHCAGCINKVVYTEP